MAEYRVEHRQHNGDLIATFLPENLEYDLNLIPPHSMSYEASLTLAQTARIGPGLPFVGPYRTDFWLYRDDLLIMAGPHTGISNEDLEASYVEISGMDWSHLLDRLPYPFDPANPNAFRMSSTGDAPTLTDPPTGLAYQTADTDVADIVNDLLLKTLEQEGAIDISFIPVTTGNTQNYRQELYDDESMLSKIQSLSEQAPGFEWQVDPFKIMEIFYPHRYTDGVDDDSSLAGYIFRSSDPDPAVVGPNGVTYSNLGPDATVVVGQGAGTATRIGYARKHEGGIAEFRRMVKMPDFGDVTSRTEVRRRTIEELGRSLNPTHEVVVKPALEKIDNFFDVFQPGMAIWIDWDLVWARINAAFQIINVNVKVSNEGEEDCTLGLNQIYPLNDTVGVQGV